MITETIMIMIIKSQKILIIAIEMMMIFRMKTPKDNDDKISDDDNE